MDPLPGAHDGPAIGHISRTQVIAGRGAVTLPSCSHPDPSTRRRCSLRPGRRIRFRDWLVDGTDGPTLEVRFERGAYERTIRDGPVRHVVIDMEAMTDVDATGAETFDALLGWLHQRMSPSRSAACAPPRAAASRNLGSSAIATSTRPTALRSRRSRWEGRMTLSAHPRARLPPRPKAQGTPFFRVADESGKWPTDGCCGWGSGTTRAGCTAAGHDRIKATSRRVRRRTIGPKGRFRFGSGW